MAGKTKNVWLIKFALSIAGKKMWSDLEKKSKNSRKAQHEVLLNILHWAKDTVYGTEHCFDRIKTVEDFQRYVPINDYATLQPYIKRHTEGEGNVLFPGKPFLYATTSGTTDEPKWIPITEKYYKECYNELSKLWFYSLLKEIPDIFNGPDLSIVGKAVEGMTPDGTPYGSFSGHVYENIPRFLKAVHVVPAEVYYIDDYFSRYYCLLRFTLEQKIRLIITGNPSTLLELHKMVKSSIDRFIIDIERGTLNTELKIEKTLREVIVKHLKPNPARARQLKALTVKYKNILPKH
jgi:hypothetical protein